MHAELVDLRAGDVERVRGASAEAADRAEDPEVARRERLTALFYALGERRAPPDGLWASVAMCICSMRL